MVRLLEQLWYASGLIDARTRYDRTSTRLGRSGRNSELTHLTPSELPASLTASFIYSAAKYPLEGIVLVAGSVTRPVATAWQSTTCSQPQSFSLRVRL